MKSMTNERKGPVQRKGWPYLMRSALASLVFSLLDVNAQAAPFSDWVMEHTNVVPTTLNAVAFANGVFVAVGGAIVTSKDAVEWTPQQTPLQGSLFDITYANGLFVAVGTFSSGDAFILTSPDGSTWTARSAASRYPLYGITFGNGRFVAVGYAGEILYSTDAIVWTSVKQPTV